MEKIKAIWAALPVKKKIAVGVVAVFILLALVSGAKAQQNCGPAQDVLSVLKDQFGESIVGQGLSQGAIIQLWANDDTGTWTIVAVSPNGGACMLSAGSDFQHSAPKPNV